MSEKLNLPLQFEAAITQFKPRLLIAISKLEVPSTLNFCFEVNYSLAYCLSRYLNIPVKPLNRQIYDGFVQNQQPFIGFARHSQIKNKDLGQNTDSHGFLCVFGVKDKPVLVDAANDQIDKNDPFLVTDLYLREPRYDMLLSELRRKGRKVRDPYLAERGTILEYNETNHYFETLEILVKENKITPKQKDIGIRQFDEHKEAGLADSIEFMIPDLLSYLIGSLGYHYTSNQKIQDELFKYFKATGGLHYSHLKQIQLDNLTYKLAKLLSDLPKELE